MKTRLLHVCTVLALTALPASAEIIGVEQFDYPDGAIAGRNEGTFWDYKNTSPTSHTGTKSNWDDIFSGGSTSVSGGRLVTNNNGWAKREYNGANESDGAVNEVNVAKTVYARVTVTTGATLPNYFGLASYDFGAERMFVGKRIGSSTFGYEISGGASGSGPITVPTNATFTLVFRLDFPGDAITLFLNPDLNLPMADSANLATAVASATYTGTNWSTALRLASGSGGDPVMWDDFVVATTWEDLGTIVTTADDEDDGSLGGGAGISLREAVRYSPAGTLVTFASSLSGQTITLTHADGDMLIPSAVTIDATALSGGLTVSGNDTHRHFKVDAGKSLTLRGLTLTRGNGTGSGQTVGGSIINDGTLTLHRCILTGNASTAEGGAIYSTGTLRATDGTISENTASGFGGGLVVRSSMVDLTRCTLTGNVANSGGAIWNESTSAMTLSHCTVTGNRSTGANSVGGMFTFTGTTTLHHCTVSQNTGNGVGGGLYLQSPATVNIQFSIVAGNADPGGTRPDIYYNGGTLTPAGTNLIGSNTSVETQFPTGTFVGTAAAPKDPKLSPLGYFGGPVQTLHPLIGSPAIDTAGATDPGGTDARGFPRFVDGDVASAGAQLDIGAVEAGPLTTVAFASDTGNPGTLRQRIGVAAASPGGRIGFFPGSNFPGTITLNGTQLDIPATPGLFIDASNLSGPVTISGDNESRVFSIPVTATVAIHSLRIVNGLEVGGDGGGIHNSGRLTLCQTTVSNNAARIGGGLFNNQSGTLALDRCTLSTNAAASSYNGGGIHNRGKLTMNQSTIFGNSAYNGGGIDNDFGGSFSVEQSTLSGNSASNAGGGLYTFGGTNALKNSIVAGNTAPASPDTIGTFTSVGTNLTSGDPLLAPLGDYGDPTQTMALRPGSPARNAAVGVSEVQRINIGALPVSFTLTFKGATTTTLNQSSTAGQVQAALLALSTVGSGNVAVIQTPSGNSNIHFQVTFTGTLADSDQPLITSATVTVTTLTEGYPAPAHRTDQRGFPIVGVHDIGAYEAGTLTNYNAFIWETLPTTATAPQHAATFDYDGDGATNEDEYIAGTLVANPGGVFRITQSALSNPNFSVTFPTVSGRTYQLQSSPDLANPWTNIGSAAAGTGSNVTLPANVTGFTRYFFRVSVSGP